MATEEERCAEAKRFQRIHDAFRTGDLEALRAAVDDPAIIPNRRMPVTIGSCLVYAIYHSPIGFIRTLLEIGADANAPADDGFPPLIAALCSGRDVPGAMRRTDVDEILRLLLSFGADPNQRGRDSAKLRAHRRDYDPRVRARGGSQELRRSGGEKTLIRRVGLPNRSSCSPELL